MRQCGDSGSFLCDFGVVERGRGEKAVAACISGCFCQYSRVNVLIADRACSHRDCCAGRVSGTEKNWDIMAGYFVFAAQCVLFGHVFPLYKKDLADHGEMRDRR